MSVFDWVNFDNLEIIAAGSSTVVFSDGNYAIKIGLIDPKQPKMIEYAHSHGYSVPMITYQRYVQIPQVMQDMIAKTEFYQNNEIYTDQEYRLVTYIQNGCADVMICGLAEPWLKHGKKYTASSMERAYDVARKLAINYETFTRGYWMDAHPWNLAKYKGKLVIIDF